MPFGTVGHERGVGQGLSSWLNRFVRFVNDLEREVRGRPGLEKVLAGRQDAAAELLRRKIEEERRLQEQVVANLRGDLDRATQASLAAASSVADLAAQIDELGRTVTGNRVSLSQRIAELTRTVADSRGDLASRLIALAAITAQFPITLPCQPLSPMTRAGSRWTRMPGTSNIVITMPGTVTGVSISLSATAHGVRLTGSGMSARMRIRNDSVTNPGQSASVTTTSATGQTLTIPVVTATGRRGYALEASMSRPSTRSDLDGLVATHVVVEASVS